MTIIVIAEDGHTCIIASIPGDAMAVSVTVTKPRTCGKCRRVVCFLINRDGATACLDCDSKRAR